MTSPSQRRPPPKQEQDYPGRTAEVDPAPRDEMRDYEGSGLLAGRAALVTGGDPGIGRAVAVAFAKEGADVAIAYLSEQEDEDARHTAGLVEKAGHRCVTIRGDLAEDGSQVPMGGPHTRTRSPRRMCSSQPAGCPATTPVRCWPRWAAGHCPASPSGKFQQGGRMGLAEALRDRVDGEVRFDAGPAARTPPTRPISGRCR
jgi:short chain dehydrogenase